MSAFDFTIVQKEFDALDDNIDVEIQLESGERYYATFFTIANIKSLFQKNRISGECRQGLYMWASDMILVEQLSQSVVEDTIESLIRTGELSIACSKL